MPEWLDSDTDVVAWATATYAILTLALTVAAIVGGRSALANLTEARMTRESSLRPVVVFKSAGWDHDRGPDWAVLEFQNVGPGPALTMNGGIHVGLEDIEDERAPDHQELVNRVAGKPGYEQSHRARIFPALAPGEIVTTYVLLSPDELSTYALELKAEFDYTDVFGNRFNLREVITISRKQRLQRWSAQPPVSPDTTD